MGRIISFENLSVTPYEVQEILDLKMEHKVNEHSTLYMKALLSEEVKDSYVKNCRQGSEVSVSIKNSEKDGVLFCGIIKDIEVNVVQGTYYMKLYAVSYSYLLDLEKKSRTFQDKQNTYDKLVSQIMESHEGAMILDVASQGSGPGRLIVQYQETDWEFLKRLASHFNTGMVNDVCQHKTRCYFGIPNNKTHTMEAFHYRVRQDIGKFLKLSQNGVNGIMERDFVYYEIESEEPANIGDIVNFRNQKLYVCGVKASMDRGIFLFQLTLTTKNGMSQLFQMHDRIAGVSLNAKIDEVENDRVKVSLEIDKEANHNPGKQCFFPYSTIYSSKDGSGWYCMPEKGDSVRIYFPDGVEEHGYAISSVHDEVEGKGLQEGSGNGEGASPGGETGSGSRGGSGSGTGGGGYSGKRDDPSVKSLRNQDGKEIRLTPGGIYIIADGTTITLTDEGGVSIVSDRDIEFKSDKNILISAKQDISIAGLAGVDLSCNETASVRLEENVEVIGQEVKAN